MLGKWVFLQLSLPFSAGSGWVFIFIICSNVHYQSLNKSSLGYNHLHLSGSLVRYQGVCSVNIHQRIICSASSGLIVAQGDLTIHIPCPSKSPLYEYRKLAEGVRKKAIGMHASKLYSAVCKKLDGEFTRLYRSVPKRNRNRSMSLVL